MTTLAKISIDPFHSARGAERRTAMTGGTLRTAPNRPLDVVVLDLSTSGVAIETKQPIAMGSTFSIGIPGLAVRRAIVVRKTENGYGCIFQEPIPANELARVGADTLIFLPGGSNDAGALPEPHVERWSRRSRLLFMIGLTTLLWAAILGISRII